MDHISYQDFDKVDIRVGKILEVHDFPEAKKPAYRLLVDLGELDVKQSSAQIAHYNKQKLIGKLVLCVVNFPKKKIAGFESEVLVLGVPDEYGQWILVSPDREVPLGGKLA